jgi:hypothetical protein
MTTLIKYHDISEKKAYEAALSCYKNLTRPFPEFKIYSEKTCVSKFSLTYAVYKCFNFKRMKQYRKGKKPMYYTVYDVEKIMYDNSYDCPYRGLSEEDYLSKQKSWFAD